MNSNFSSSMLDPQESRDFEGRWFGVYSAIVSNNQDPDAQGRVKVRLPWMHDSQNAEYQAWARMATLMAGNNRGSWFMPDVNDEVLVAFEAGDPRRPYIIGGLWNGVDAPPEEGDGTNNRKVLQSRKGIRILLDDQDGAESFIVETPGGQKIQLKDIAGGSVEICDCNGNSITIDSKGITVVSNGAMKVNANSLEISTGLVKLNAPLLIVSGIVKCDTVVANSVVASSYTPGAGNIW